MKCIGVELIAEGAHRAVNVLYFEPSKVYLFKIGAL